MTLPATHPIEVLRHHARNATKLLATFQGYTWTPGKETVVDWCPTFNRDQILGDRLETWLAEPRDYEIGLRSQVLVNSGEVWQIPMVDFAARVDKCPKLSEHKPLPPSLVDGFYFQTQRSFHGYGNTLIRDDEFVEFMARCLLLNQPLGGTEKMRPLVDPLWVGWQLLRKYAVLRWTANTKRWDALPSRIPCPIPTEIAS